jgi:hypothetical protein
VRKQDGNGHVAMKGRDPPVFYVENVAARCVHWLSGRRNCPGRQGEIAVMRTVERQFYDNHVVFKVETIKLSMHIGEGGRIHICREPDIVPTVFVSTGHIIKVASFRKWGK